MTGPNIGVAILHGIGSHEPGYSQAFVQRVVDALKRGGTSPNAFAFQEILWSHTLETSERNLLSRAQEGGRLDWTPLRMFVVETLADAVAYRRAYPRTWDTYHQIHWEVYSGLEALRDRLSDASSPLVLIAHSLGSVIMSDHVWDEQKQQGFGRCPFTRCETLAGIVTLGSNIPLFTLALPEVQCITFPPRNVHLRQAVVDSARWCNYFDRDDVLGYPLRTLSASYFETVSDDVEMNAGGALTSWNPLSHNGYWAEPQFVEAVASQLASLNMAFAGANRVSAAF